jgi:hypothetical protein
VCFKWLIDYDIKWLQHLGYASWFDYQILFLSSLLGLQIFSGMALDAVQNQHGLVV